MRKPNGVRLILALVNVVLIVAAVFIVNSRAAEDGGPNYTSFGWPTETEPALRALTGYETPVSGGSSTPVSPTPASSTAGADISGPLVAPTGKADSAPFSETNESFEQVWNAHVHPAFAPMASDSSSLQPGVSLSGYGSAANTPGYSARSAPAGGFGGGGAGGGFPSSGGGGSAQGSLSSASNHRAGLLSQSNSSIAGTSLLPTPAQGSASFGTPASQGARATAGVSQLQPVSVPEPSTLLLLGGGLALAAYRSRRTLTH